MHLVLRRLCLVVALMLSAPLTAQAVPAPVLGNLSDGAVHFGSTTGYWLLTLNAGDSVTITGRRMSGFDPQMFVFDTTDTLDRTADDELPANPGFGGGFGDPQFGNVDNGAYVASVTGNYYVGLFRFNSLDIVEDLSYSIQATGSTAVAETPLPAALPLLPPALARSA